MSEQEKSSFLTMAGRKAEGEAPELGIGMLGYSFMGKAHTNALKKLPYMMYPPVAIPKLAAICGRNEEATAEAAKRYGYAKYYTDYRDMLADPNVQIFDNGGPNNAHEIPCNEAAAAGKHVFCEKPMARSTEEAKSMLDAVMKAGVKHMVAFNYRFVPAIVLARNLITSGQMGKVYHFRATYLQDWIMDPNLEKMWRLDKSQAGSGALGDLGSHVIDLARFLVGEPNRIQAITKTFITERPLPGGGRGTVDVDDAFLSIMEFENGALGSIEASRFCAGRKNYNALEINCEKGTMQFNLERLNELNVFWADDEPKETRGFHNVLVNESYHPYLENWWPSGHIIGWEHTFVHEFNHFFNAIVNGEDVNPLGATFEDGYKNAVICDAILKSGETRQMVDVKYE